MTAEDQRFVSEESDLIENPNYLGGGGVRTQLPTFDAESKSAKIPKSQSPILVEKGRGFGSNFQLLMLSPNLLKSQNSIMMGLRGLDQTQIPAFNAGFKSDKIPKYHYRGGGEFEVGGDQVSKVNFKLSNLSHKLKLPKFPFLEGGGGSWNPWNWVLTSSIHLA